MKKKYLILFSLAGLIISADQLIKSWVMARLELDSPREILGSFLTLTYKQQNGFAFGFLEKAPHIFQSVFFTAVPIFALILILLIFIKMSDDQMPASFALATIFSGAIGNLIDRLKHGYVVDFLSIKLTSQFTFPFNLSDISIIFGVLLMFIATIREEKVTQ